MKKSMIGLVAAAALALAPALAFAEDAPGQVAAANDAPGSGTGGVAPEVLVVGGVVILVGLGIGLAASSNSSGGSTSTSTSTSTTP